MRKVVILGSGGMAGHVISLMLRQEPQLFSVVDVARKKYTTGPDYILDLADITSVQKLAKAEQPDIIINAAGILNQNAESFPDEAILINSYLPHLLERITANTKTRVIHISTDCVFSGKKGSYTENEVKDGTGYYAETKALGELINKKDLTIRTSIIGPELNAAGIGLFNWFSKQEGEINGFAKAYWSGVTTTELARAIIYLIGEETTGLFQLVNHHKISKYELLQLFLKSFPGSKISSIRPTESYAIDKSLVNTRTDIQYSVPDYEKMVHDMNKWIEMNKEIYPQYTHLLL